MGFKGLVYTSSGPRGNITIESFLNCFVATREMLSVRGFSDCVSVL